MARDKEPFLSRWSRRKLDPARAEPATPPAQAEAPLPALPPVDQLGFDSDYTGFLHPKVDEALRRQALKKLFASAHFQTPDMMDDFNEDYTLLEKLAPESVSTLEHAKRTLLGGDAPPEQAQAAAEAPRDADAVAAPGEVAQAEPAPPPDPDKIDGAAG